MKIHHIALTLLAPLSVLAELEVVSLAMNPFLQEGGTSNTLIYVTNRGEEAESIPVGEVDADGRIIPSSVDINYATYKVYQHGITNISMGCSFERSMIICATATDVVTGETVHLKDNYVGRKLAPEESVTYIVDISKIFDTEQVELFDICIVTVEFDDYQLRVPPVTFYKKE